MRWRAKCDTRKGTKSHLSELTKKLRSKYRDSTRVPQVVEVYVKLYWSTKLKAAVEERFLEGEEAHGGEAEAENGHDDMGESDGEHSSQAKDTKDKAKKKRWMALYQSVTRQMYEEEDDDVKGEVLAELERLKSAAEDAKVKEAKEVEEDGHSGVLRTPEQKLEYVFFHSNEILLANSEHVWSSIQDLAGILSELLGELSDLSGWAFTVLMGGPDPQLEGKIRVARYFGIILLLHNVLTDFQFSSRQDVARPLVRICPPKLRRGRS
jgi:hypothetical protein